MDAVTEAGTAMRAGRAARMARLLKPRSVAVIGGDLAAEVITQCRALGFTGRLMAVNSKRPDLASIATVARIEDLPEIPDAAFIAVNSTASIEAVAALRRLGCGGAVCHAAGFAEIGDGGAALQAGLVEAAGDMLVLGPNCYGLLNLMDGVALWPDVHGGALVDRGVAIISQSGNIAINMTMQQRSLPLAVVITLGNQAMVGVSDAIEALLEDGRISAIGLHIEGLGDIPRFSRVAIRALERRVPIVALKVGRSAHGARTALSHTSTLSGADQLYDVLFARHGIHRAEGISGFLEALKALHVLGPQASAGIATVSCSGGEAGLMADIGARLGLEFPSLTPDQTADLRAVLRSNEALGNPLDYHTFIWGDGHAMRRCFAAVMRGPAEVTAMAYDFPRDGFDWHGYWMAGFRAFAAAAAETGARAAIISNLPENQPVWAGAAMLEAGIAPLQGLEDGLAAIKASAEIGMAQNRPPPVPLADSAIPVRGPGVPLNEAEGKRILARAGIAVPDALAVVVDEAGTAASRLGFPVVLKALGGDLAHKTEQGAVALSLATTEDVLAAAERMRAFGDQVLVEKMIGGVVAEMIVGVVRDPQFGLYVTVGAGGLLVELLRDSAIILLPATVAEIRAALGGLRISPLLGGWRGGPAGDVEALVNAILAIARLAEAEGDGLLEFEVNPLLVLPEGRGVMAVDAMIRLTEA